jgi:thiosulfate/3-mercaptopyruvate sulfurtransferase
MNTTTPAEESAHTSDGHRAVLANPAWLAEHLADPDLCVVEVDVSPAAYDQWHIDGAVFWNIYRDLKDPDFRLRGPTEMARLFTHSGIRPGSTVVFYGYAPAMAFWLMRLYGHRDVRILDCSRDTWRAEGHPWTTAPALPPEAAPTGADPGLPGHPAGIRVDHVAVRRAITDPTVTLLDVRSRAEYTGDRFWPSGGLDPNGRAGHVPGAVHQPLDGVYDSRGAFRAPAELRRILSAVDLEDPGELITYCTIGGRASTAWFVLTYLLGRSGVSVYDGSWVEWGRMSTTPVTQRE